LLKKNSKIDFPNAFRIDNAVTADRYLIVNAFNKYFVEVGPSLAKKIVLPRNVSIFSLLLV
jgi:hypothetical protein